MVLDTGSVSRGSGSSDSNRERDIRAAVVKAGLISAVILLPDNLFYNTSSPGVIVILDTSGSHSEEVQVVNAAAVYAKGSPKNRLADSHVEEIADVILNRVEVENLSKLVPIGVIAGNDFNLSPEMYVAAERPAPIEDLAEAVEEARRAAGEVQVAEAHLERNLRRILRQEADNDV